MFAHNIMLVDYFLAVHRLISRGVDVSLYRVNAFIEEGFPNESAREGYLHYIQALTLMFDSHHKTEDDIAFPYFRDVLPDTHFDWLFEDHDLITGFLAELEPVVEALEGDKIVADDFVQLKDVLLKIEDRWNQHIGLEEDEFINLIDDLSTGEVRSQLFTRFSDFNRDLLNPHILTLPFMLYNLDPQDRIVILNAHPQDWFIHIDTPEWKEKRRSMAPFFLSE